LLRHFKVDAVRYFLLREMSFGQDCKVDYEVILERSNSDLASGLGNLVSRTLTMIHKYFDGGVPADEISEARRLQAKRAGVDSDAQALSSSVELVRDQFVQNVEEYAFHRALEAAWGMIARVDKFISEAKPWELARDEAQRETLGAVLYRAAETLRWLAVLLYPVMPESTSAIWKQLGLEGEPRQIDPTELKWGGLRAGAAVGEVAPLFPRIDKGKTMAEIEKEIAQRKESEAQTALPSSTTHSGAHATQAAVPGAPTAADTNPEQSPAQGATEAQAPPAGSQAQPDAATQPAQTPEGVATYITIDDFVKVELRVGEVLTAERVPKSDKLLRFTVDIGEPQPRQILAGIAEHYEPDSMVGRKLVIVSNLKPRKLRGFESQGMVLAASVGEEGRPVLATFAEDVPNGTRLK
jgi:methionyl-tRNA synthetase